MFFSVNYIYDFLLNTIYFNFYDEAGVFKVCNDEGKKKNLLKKNLY